MSKTLGQINEDAFLEKWHTIPDDTKVGAGRLICFEAAADAVVNQYIVVRSTADRALLDDKEQAVIEAARAAIPELRAHAARHFELFGNSNPYHKHPLGELLDALEALDSEEG